MLKRFFFVFLQPIHIIDHATLVSFVANTHGCAYRTVGDATEIWTVVRCWTNPMRRAVTKTPPNVRPIKVDATKLATASTQSNFVIINSIVATMSFRNFVVSGFANLFFDSYLF